MNDAFRLRIVLQVNQAEKQSEVRPESIAISVRGTEITVKGKVWSMPYRVAQAMIVGNRILVVYDSMDGPKHRQFQNLEAYSLEGARLWSAEHPNNETASSYVGLEFDSGTQVRAFNFAGYDCQIDLATGKLLKAYFAK